MTRACDLHAGYRAEHPDPNQAYVVLDVEVGDELTTVTAQFDNGKTDQIVYENSYVLPRVCPKHPGEVFTNTEDLLDHVIDHLLNLEETVTSNQERVDQDAAALRQAFDDYKASVTAAIAGLKDQLAAGVTADQLNTTALDQLLADEKAAGVDAASEAAADQPTAAQQPAPADPGAVQAPPVDQGAVPTDGSTLPVAQPATGADSPPPTAS